MSKFLVAIDLGGGMDGQLFMSPTDSATTTLIQAARQSAPANILDFTAPIEVAGTLTAGSPVITGIVTTGIANGMQVYSASLPAQRALTVSSFTANDVTLSGAATSAATGELITFATSVQLKRLKEVEATGRTPAFHYTQNFMLDTFRTLDIAGNASKVKSAVIAGLGTLRKPLLKNGTTGSIFNLLVPLAGGGTSASVKGVDVPAFLTSHNDQTSTWHANAPEGASKGWGGGIADVIRASVTPSLNREVLSVSSTSGRNVFTAGALVNPFGITPTSLVLKAPGFTGSVNEDAVVATADTLRALFFSATQTNGLTTNDFTESADPTIDLVEGFQSVLADAMQITDVPLTGVDFNIAGSRSLSATTFCSQLRSLARMMLTVNPNRGGLATRVGTTVTIATEITSAVANRTASTTVCEVTATNHGLFTSSLSGNGSDSVVVLGDPTAIDTSIPTLGYKITLHPTDPDNKFTFTTTSNTVLTNEPVTVRLKHNLTAANKVHIAATGFDSSTPADGYAVTVVDTTSFTLTTTSSGAFTPASLPCKFKLLNLDKQVMYTNTAGFSWDTHPEAAHSQLGALNAGLAYFNSLVSRIQDADVVSFTISEFGRTLSTNATSGTDHGWGNTMMIFGKSVRGNKVYGTIPSFAVAGVNVVSNMFLPTLSVYQYGATFAKWMGLTDTQILELFPDLGNWPSNERTLTFLDPLV